MRAVQGEQRGGKPGCESRMADHGCQHVYQDRIGSVHKDSDPMPGLRIGRRPFRAKEVRDIPYRAKESVPARCREQPPPSGKRSRRMTKKQKIIRKKIEPR